MPRLYDEDYAVLALLDRVGLVPASLVGRAVLPGRAPRPFTTGWSKLYRHGLVARHSTGLRRQSSADGAGPYIPAPGVLAGLSRPFAATRSV